MKQPENMPVVEIDPRSGFCFGVVNAIKQAEEQLSRGGTLYCIGDIVHNNAEVERLRAIGLHTISHDDLNRLSDARVMLRAHGEPPSTYAIARQRGITIIDATCPVVLKLQQRIKETYDNIRGREGDQTQIVIYGRIGHAEVNGLVGQTDGTAIVVEDASQLDKIDFSRPVVLYSQTTKSLEGFEHIVREIGERLAPGLGFEYYDTICRQVASRVDRLEQFASTHDVILFVAGEKSSNGRILFDRISSVNPRSYILNGPERLTAEMVTGARSIGVCGATSTPRWLMENVASHIKKFFE